MATAGRRPETTRAHWRYGGGDATPAISGRCSVLLCGRHAVLLDDGARILASPDYLNPHSYSLFGRPYVILAENGIARFNRYRWFLEGPLSFRQTLDMELQLKHDLLSNLHISSVAYWYQTEPHQKFSPFLRVEDRLPQFAASDPLLKTS